MLNSNERTYKEIELKCLFVVSKLTVVIFVYLALAWFSASAILGDRMTMIICGIVAAVYLICLSFFYFKFHLIARAVWLFSATVTTIFGLIFGRPEADIELLFLPIIALPFLSLSWKYERKALLAFFALPLISWCLVVQYDLIGSSEHFFNIPFFSTDIDIEIINFALRATVTILLTAEFYYFTSLTTRTQAELYEAKIVAEETTRTKGAFLADMSHEIRTPMTGILGMVEVLDTINSTDEQRKMVGIARDSALTLLRIIDDILVASKIDAGKMIIENTRTDIISLVEDVLITEQSLAEQMGVKVALLIDPNVPRWVMADSERLRQLLLNILSNVIKYSSNSLTVSDSITSFSIKKGENNDIHFSVRVNGIDVSKPVLDHLLEPLVQGEGPSKSRLGGTDLGLVVAQQLIQQMGGTIDISSVVGQGANVIIGLPMQQAEEEDERIDLTGVTIELLIEIGVEVTRNITHQCEVLGMTFRKVAVQRDLSDYSLEKDEGQIFVLCPHDPDTSEIWKNKIGQFVQKPKFLILLLDHAKTLGQISQSEFCIQLHPFLITDFVNALNVLRGNKPPDRTQDPLDKNEVFKSAKKKKQKLTKLLLVEDNEINRVVLMRKIELLGFTVDVAKNGEEGFLKWQSGGFHLILSDCYMPVVDGFEMARMIRRKEDETGTTRIPIIAITANALKGDAEKCFEVGMDGYISKPVETKELEAKISVLLCSESA